MREQLEPLGFDFVAAPDRGEHFERVDRLLARHVAGGIAQQDLVQTPVRGVTPIGRNRGGMIAGERLRGAAQGFFHAADQHRDLRLHLRRQAERGQFVEDAVGAVEIAHFDRGSERLAQRHRWSSRGKAEIALSVFLNRACAWGHWRRSV